jgi:hypothetical protein
VQLSRMEALSRKEYARTIWELRRILDRDEEK